MMPLYTKHRSQIKCAKCQVPWGKHGFDVNSPKYHPMFWSNLEYLEWCSYEKDYEELMKKRNKK